MTHTNYRHVQNRLILPFITLLLLAVLLTGCPGGQKGPVASIDLPGEGGTIHALLCLADEDAVLGESAKADRQHIGDWLTATSQMTGLAVRQYVFRESDKTLTQNALYSTMQRLNVAPDDVIVFYYSGHGDANHGGSPWPDMLFGGWSLFSAHHVHAEQVHRDLLNRPVRLVITLVDSCNSDVEAELPPANSHDTRFAYIPQNWRTGDAAHYRKLFLHSRGSILMSAASRGQNAASITTHEEASEFGFPGLGAVFTYFFLQSFYNEVNATPNADMSWRTIVRNSEVPVVVKARNIYHVPQDETVLVE
jgi:hypothetical protein